MMPHPKRPLLIPDYISPENTEAVYVRLSLKDLSGFFAVELQVPSSAWGAAHAHTGLFGIHSIRKPHSGIKRTG